MGLIEQHEAIDLKRDEECRKVISNTVAVRHVSIEPVDVESLMIEDCSALTLLSSTSTSTVALSTSATVLTNGGIIPRAENGDTVRLGQNC